MYLQNEVRYRYYVVFVILVLVVSAAGCQSAEPNQGGELDSPPDPSPELRPSATWTSEPTDPPPSPTVPTNTSQPTETPLPTATPTEQPPPTATSTPTVESVEGSSETIPLSLKAKDGVRLSGALVKPDQALDNGYALLLGHELASNRQSWKPLLEDFMAMGFSALSFDFRGHGESEGSQDFTTLAMDAGTFLQYLLDEGYDKILCLGSSMGGTACLELALSVDMEGLAAVSSPMNIQGSGVTKSELAALNIPKLVMVAEQDMATANDPDFVNDILKMYEWAPAPKELFVSPGSIAHGLALLYGSPGEEARALLFEFLAGVIGE